MGYKLEHVVISRRWLTTPEAAAYLSTSKQKIIDLMNTGELTRHKLGPHTKSRVLVSQDDLDEYVARCARPARAT